VIEFEKAVLTEEEKAELEVSPTKVKHWGTDLIFFEPSDGQLLMMLAMGGRGMSKKQAGHFVQLVIALGDEDTQNYLQDMMFDRESGFTLKGPGGLFDIWEKLTTEWSGKDSEKPSGSPKSRSRAGSASTGTSRRRASTSSGSRSTRS
jgi:hypothetical protein